LHAFDGELAAQCASATVFDHVPDAVDRCGLSHNAPIQFFISRFQPFHHFHRAIYRRTFFIAGQQIGNGKPRMGFLL